MYHHHDDDVEQVRHGFQPLELEDDELVGGDVEGRRPVEEVPVSAIRAEIPEIERELARDRLQMLDTVEIGCGTLRIGTEPGADPVAACNGVAPTTRPKLERAH